ncbi:MAG: packaged DNA stabilization protein, partial [Dehalococcoidales bacterium]
GTVATLGAISGTDTVSLPYSFNTQAIIADGRMWLYDTTAGFNEITDADLGDPIDGVWVDGYYFLTDGEFIYHTDITDESSIDPLKFATAEFMPDKSLGLGKTQDNKVLVFGRYTCEYFVNDASEQFSFARVASRAVKIGIVGTHAKAEMGDKWYLLGSRKEESISVHVLGVGAAQKVATREVDKIIGLYTENQLQGAVVEPRTEDGYSFLIVHLPNHVLQFNETLAKKSGIEQAWTILKTDVTGDLPWRAKHGLFEPRKGQWVYGDKRDSKIGILDNTVATHYGDISEWILDTPFTNLESMSINSLELETLPGHTTTLDATVFVSMIYNGVTFGSEFIELYGEPSEYGERFILRRLGDVTDWFSFRFRGASRSRMAFSKATFDYG